MVFIVLLILAIISTEAITEIVTKTKLFQGVRERIKKSSSLPDYIKYLVSCPHCFSVWVGGFVTYLMFYKYKFSPVFPNKFICIFVLGIVIHRLSNYLHMFVDRFIDKFYKEKG